MKKLKLSDLTITGEKRPNIILFNSTLLEIISRMKLAGLAQKANDTTEALAQYTQAMNLGSFVSGIDQTPLQNFKRLRLHVGEKSNFEYTDAFTQVKDAFEITNKTQNEVLEVRNVSHFGVTLEISRERKPDDTNHPIEYLQAIDEKNNGYVETFHSQNIVGSS
jgi:hypothetical protein